MTDLCLYDFHFSPYCEKVRWALDLKALPYWRKSLLPGPHVATVRPKTGRSQLPVLTINGEAVDESSAILDRIEALAPTPPLYPDDPALVVRGRELQELGDATTAAIRSCLMERLLTHREYYCNITSWGQGTMQRRAFKLGFPALRPLIRAKYGLGKRPSPKYDQVLTSAMDALDRRIEGDYLLGDHFTFADLAVAASISTLLPDGPSPYGLQSRMPDELETWRAQFRSRPAMQWATGIYIKHRGVSMSNTRTLRGSSLL